MIGISGINWKPKTRRVQINLSVEDYHAAKVLATECGQSLSEVIRGALLRQIAESAVCDPLGAIIGIVEDADPNGSEEIDRAVYGGKH